MASTSSALATLKLDISVNEKPISLAPSTHQGQNLSVSTHSAATGTFGKINEETKEKAHDRYDTWQDVKVRALSKMGIPTTGRSSRPRESVAFTDNIPPGIEPSPLAKKMQHKEPYFGKDVMKNYTKELPSSINQVIRHIWPKSTEGGPSSSPTLQEIKTRIGDMNQMILDQRVHDLLETRIGEDFLSGFGQQDKDTILNPEMLFVEKVEHHQTDSATMSKFIKDPALPSKIGVEGPDSPRINIGTVEWTAYSTAGTELQKQAAISVINTAAVGLVKNNFFTPSCKEFNLLKDVLKSYEALVDKAIADEATVKEQKAK